MSRTDRDDKKYNYKHHKEVCKRWMWPALSRSCECDTWHDYHWYNMPEPSWWRRGIREQEKAFARSRIQRARAGKRDWSEVDDRKGDEYYW